jgi:hypothetical protein
MFKANNQQSLFSFSQELNEKQRKQLERSKEKWFHELVFMKIDEMPFKVLYADVASRPNAPVNVLVAAMILKELKGISYDELMESVMFDLRYKIALGLTDITDIPFSRATLFNFQGRVCAHEQQTGENLIEKVFDNLSAKQLKQLEIKTDIQRTDSTLVASNIRRYSRLQLLIEVLLRLERILDERDKAKLGKLIEPFVKKRSEKYIYALKAADIPHELSKLGKIYHEVFMYLVSKTVYAHTKEFANFERVFTEHFVVVENSASPKDPSQLNSSMLQSPDDPDATHRKKSGQDQKGFTLNAVETANPENSVQLVTDIAVTPNNVDDSKILEDRTEKMLEKTPELNELHTDGGYGSQANDEAFEENNITQVTTAVRGRQDQAEKTIKRFSPTVFTVACLLQRVVSTPTKQRHRAKFDMKVCNNCPLKERCGIYKQKGRFYFTEEDYRQNKRSNNIMQVPAERRKLRPNVEALMFEFKCRLNHKGKLKTRGLFKASLFAFTTAMAVNFGRIHRYKVKNGQISGVLNSLSAFFNNLWLLIRPVRPGKPISGISMQKLTNIFCCNLLNAYI